jgi:hypothetical protein
LLDLPIKLRSLAIFFPKNQLLLDAGANIDMRSEFMKRTPIALAVISPSGHGCIDALLDRGKTSKVTHG